VVTFDNVGFTNDRATGGAGGQGAISAYGGRNYKAAIKGDGGGGGGLGGVGGAGRGYGGWGGGGGGVGTGAFGGSYTYSSKYGPGAEFGGSGILLGSQPGGSFVGSAALSGLARGVCAARTAKQHCLGSP
jgi:hypothetical protein